MKHALKLVIRVYWKLIPTKYRQTCLFRESCSSHIFRVTEESGFVKGIIALKSRFKKCKPGYSFTYNEETAEFELQLVDGGKLTKSDASGNITFPEFSISDYVKTL